MMLLSTGLSPFKRAPESMLVFISWCGASSLAWHILWCGYFSMAQISHPALFHRALTCYIGEISVDNLLPRLTAMVIEAFVVFIHHLKMHS